MEPTTLVVGMKTKNSKFSGNTAQRPWSAKDPDQLYRLTNWLMFLCGQIQSPRPDVMPDRREGIARAEGFVSARIETSVS